MKINGATHAICKITSKAKHFQNKISTKANNINHTELQFANVI